MYGTFPSVTTVLANTKSAESKAALDNWYATNINADRLAEEARVRGTFLHQRIERHLSALPPEDWSTREKELGVPVMWKSVQPHLSRIHDARYIEVPIFDSSHGFAGTLDLINVTAEGEVEIWDWKNSLRYKREEYVEDYFCQIAAYAKAAPKCLPFFPGKVMRARVIIALPTGPAQEFMLTEKRIDYYYRFFLRRLLKFKNLGSEYSFTPPSKPTRRRY